MCAKLDQDWEGMTNEQKQTGAGEHGRAVPSGSRSSYQVLIDGHHFVIKMLNSSIENH